MTRTEKIQDYLETHSNDITEEIKYYFETGVDEEWCEGEYDLVAAGEDAIQLLESNKITKIIKEYYLFLGDAVPVSDKELEMIEVTSGSKFWFTLNGQKYRWQGDF